MHLGNGIICPVTGIPMLAIAGITAFYAYKNMKKDFNKDKILLTVTLTGLVFALQMINFAIPTTGSSGHIVGAVLLSALLGPYAAFLAMCSILLVQSVFFADGGLLALGCNIFNMGFLACFVAYPLLYKTFASKNKSFTAAVLASVGALQLGAIAVVAESFFSGSVEASGISNFALLMQAIHLPIGIVEGIVTGGIVIAAKFIGEKKLSIFSGTAAFVLAGVISNYASQKPDGLEWSLLSISDSVVMQTQNTFYSISEAVQAKTSIFASMPYTVGSVAGLIVIGCIIYLGCIWVNNRMVKENAE